MLMLKNASSGNTLECGFFILASQPGQISEDTAYRFQDITLTS
jgi:hypothetical protein